MEELRIDITTDRLELKPLNSADYMFAVFLKGECTQIGKVGLGAGGWLYEDEIDATIYKDYRKNGYASEAITAVKERAISCGIDPWMQAFRWNDGGNAVAKKSGFTLNRKGLIQNLYVV